MLDSKARPVISKLTDVIGRGLAKMGFTANSLTLMGLAASGVSAGFLASGHRIVAGAVLLGGGLIDVFDGAVARARGSSGPKGAFLDSVCDRASDGAVLGALVWWEVERAPRLAVLALVVLIASFLVSYTKARAQSLGFKCDVGVAERAERVLVLGVGLISGLIEPALWVLAVATLVTVVQRVVVVLRQASPE
ncbi:MAG: CDP-alcohol phosphatidyltransferase family protein [Actinomycetota bacterium]